MARDHRFLCAAAFGLALWPLAGTAQTVFVCDNGGRTFVVTGAGGAPGCRALAAPERDLGLAQAEPDLAALGREIARLSARVDRLEALVAGVRVTPRAPSPTLRQTDPFDTRGRMRDLGQDVDRRLERR